MTFGRALLWREPAASPVPVQVTCLLALPRGVFFWGFLLLFCFSPIVTVKGGSAAALALWVPLLTACEVPQGMEELFPPGLSPVVAPAGCKHPRAAADPARGGTAGSLSPSSQLLVLVWCMSVCRSTVCASSQVCEQEQLSWGTPCSTPCPPCTEQLHPVLPLWGQSWARIVSGFCSP